MIRTGNGLATKGPDPSLDVSLTPPFTLPEPLRTHFCGRAQILSYGPRVPVIKQGDPAHGVFVVQSGGVKLSHVTPSGRTVLSRLATTGGVVGLNEVVSGTPHRLTVETVSYTQFEHVPEREFMSLLHERPWLAVELLNCLSQQLEALQSALCEVITQVPIRERLLHKLQDFAKAFGDSIPEGALIRLPLTGQDLADSLGCSRQWVSGLLRDLEKDGLIRRRHRALIVTHTVLNARYGCS